MNINPVIATIAVKQPATTTDAEKTTLSANIVKVLHISQVNKDLGTQKLPHQVLTGCGSFGTWIERKYQILETGSMQNDAIDRCSKSFE